ncbi:ATP-dependent RecD-like DNA helicase [Cyanobium sp. LEGE 06143]|uniref:ATP-dependent DNA helicase n=1 Tax=Cyanobium sp. LEGE 06143 TaxID=945727 RepID=UPI001D15240B|nr:AAA family ATPase [Cyanobium sp. LEGE 06143]
MSQPPAPAEPPVPGTVFTAGQQAACTGFAAWLAEPAEGRPFVLSGYAGTGKTFLSMAFLQLVEAQQLCWTVVAPTHKAVGVLRHHLGRAALQPTWYPSTIHRLLRLRLKRQGDRERCEETEQTAAALEHLGLVLVDEASMVDSTLLEISLRCAHPFGTRLVFVGDPAQLPPVGEPCSPVFSLGRAAAAELTEVVRHQGPVLQLAQGIREQRLPARQPPALPPVRTAVGEVALLPRQQWLEAAQDALRRSAATDNPDLARILCYTNRSLEQLVPIARRALHGAMADQLPVLPGEVLITRSAVMAPACREGDEAAEEPDMVLGSNRELLVRDVTPERCDLGEFGFSSADLGGGLAVPVVDTLMAAVDSGDSQFNLRLLPPLGTAGRAAIEQVLATLRQQARSADKQAGRALWRRFFLLRDAFAALGPAAVLTVHRSQGSTFSEVFVDGDVFWPGDPLLRRQLLYVAVSRASQRVALVAGGGARGGGDARLWQQWLSSS